MARPRTARAARAMVAGGMTTHEVAETMGYPERWVWIHTDPAARLPAQAHYAVYLAVRAGALVRPDLCSDCGAKGRIHGHHPDYTRPLDVEWLCERCHKKRHPRSCDGRGYLSLLRAH